MSLGSEPMPVVVGLEEIAEMLSHAIGNEKASVLVAAAAQQLRCVGPMVTRDQALQILDTIATTPGIVGITARFAKSRLHLKWASAD